MKFGGEAEYLSLPCSLLDQVYGKSKNSDPDKFITLNFIVISL